MFVSQHRCSSISILFLITNFSYFYVPYQKQARPIERQLLRLHLYHLETDVLNIGQELEKP